MFVCTHAVIALTTEALEQKLATSQKWVGTDSFCKVIFKFPRGHIEGRRWGAGKGGSQIVFVTFCDIDHESLLFFSGIVHECARKSTPRVAPPRVKRLSRVLACYPTPQS